MKFIIEGKEYDAEAGISKASLSTLYELKTKHGIGIKTLAEMASKFDGVTDPLQILEDKGAFRTFMIIIWLARKHAGEDLSVDEANSFPMDAMQLVAEDEPAPDPKAIAGSGQDAAPPPPPPTT